jgi:predicted deacylase
VASVRPTLIIGGIHGSEPTSAYVAHRLAEYLAASRPNSHKRPVAIMPFANPDGLLVEQRTNARGVDVNRNFPATNWRPHKHKLYYNGPHPSSEPETHAILKAIDTLKPARIISIHSIERGKHCNNYDGPAESLAQLMHAHNRYPVTATMGYPTPGSLGSYAGIDRQIPIVTLELPRETSGPVAWEENREALLAAIAAPE